MDNVVQNINIEDIIPNKFQPSNDEQQKIVELAQLTKAFGLLDPILVRPKNDKYEVIMGMDKYQAALLANLKEVPVIIKEVDDEVFTKYSSIDNKNKISLNSSSAENMVEQKFNKKQDIINLAELSKIKIEYERDDFKMNNGQINNNIMNNNLGQASMNQANQGPTFGGKFFPSLEDEPTNMNMIGGITAQSIPPENPVLNNNIDMGVPNNNLIDLTDLSSDKEPTIAPTTDFGIPNFGPSPLDVTPPVDIVLSQNNFSTTQEPQAMPSVSDSIINLGNIQNNNPPVQSFNESVSMDTLNADFGPPASSTSSQINIGPSIDLTTTQPQGFKEPSKLMNSSFNQAPYLSPEPNPIIPTPELNTAPTAPVNNDFGIPNSIPTPSSPVTPTKDITPVTNTITNLVSNLEKFGYKIKVTEEDLPTSAKIFIEIEK